MRNLHLKPFVIMASLSAVLSAEAQPTTIVLQVRNGVSIGYHDNYNTENTNYYNAPQLGGFSQPGTTGGVNKGRGLMDFDLTGIPPAARIISAHLSLIGMGPFGTGIVGMVGSTGANASTLRRVTSPWEPTMVTWNTQPTTTMQHAVPLRQSEYADQNYLSVDVTALVQDMVDDPANSFGFLMQLDDETPSRGLVFHSSAAGRPDQRPVLVVSYGECDLTTLINAPDPTTSELTITPNIATVGSDLTINASGSDPVPIALKVMDGLGRIVASAPVRPAPQHWTVPMLAPGRYLVSAMDANGHVLGIRALTIVQ
ncbi:MAG: DNRLRE domain-containing protein [Flavobacteriales bacterium]